MPQSIRSFDRINIPAPCEADWDSMIGNDKVRFCEHCNLQVTNLSSLTHQAAINLVERSQGRLCVRLEKRAGGGLIMKQSAPRLHQIARRASRLAAGAFSATLSIASASAQTSAPTQQLPAAQMVEARARRSEAGCSLSGVVSDPSGAVVPGAVVSLTGIQTGSMFTLTADDEGAYNFALLPSGSYQLTTQATGFAKFESEVRLVDGQDKSMNLALQIPELVVEVEINAPPPMALGGVVAFSPPEEPIVNAAFQDDLEGVRQLAFSTLDINVRDKNINLTALEQAVENGNLEIVRTLLLAGASVNVKNESGRTALMYLRESATPDLVRELLSAGAKINARDESGGTALMNAASRGNHFVVGELITAGAKIELKDADGWTALMFAANNSDVQATRLLIDAGADVRASSESGKTPLMIAADEGRSETVQLLLSFNAEVNARDNDGWSALMFAVGMNDMESTQLLLNAGADVSVTSNEGKTLLAIARDRENDEMIKLLQSRGAP